MNKGQIFAADFLVAALLFISIFFLVNTLWIDLNAQIFNAKNLDNLHRLSMTISDVLIKNPGHPFDWTSADVQTIGLAEEAHILNKTKILRLVNMDYDSALEVFGAGGYDVFITFTYRNGSIADIDGTPAVFGTNVSSSAGNVVNIQRIAAIHDVNRTLVNMNVVIWT